MNPPLSYNFSQNNEDLQSDVNQKYGSSTFKESDNQKGSSSDYKESVDKTQEEVSDICNNVCIFEEEGGVLYANKVYNTF